MLKALTRKYYGRRVLLAGTLLLAIGCSSSKPTSSKLEGYIGNSNEASDKHTEQSANEFIFEFLKALANGKVDASSFTISFKAKVAQPKKGDQEDIQAGFNRQKFDEYLKKISNEPYETFSYVPTGSGPFAVGQIQTSSGRTENFVLQLVPTNDSLAWRVNWFQRAPAYFTFIPAQNTIGPESVAALLMAECFMDNLLAGDMLLAEAILSKTWKTREYGSNTPSDADLGYSRALLHRKFGEWKAETYTFVDPKVTAGQTPTFDVVTFDTKGVQQKILSLKMSKKADGEWVVEDIQEQK